MGLVESIIRSLDKEEQRYISKEVITERDTKVRTLFDLILEHGDDDEKIASRFKRLEPRANMSAVRSQLQNILLKGMEHYHAADYTESELNSLILQIKVFGEKRAFDVVRMLFKRATEIATENELFPQQMVLYSLKRTLYKTKNYPEEEPEEYLIEEGKKSMLQHQNYAEYQWLHMDEMKLVNKNYILRSEEMQQQWDTLMQNELLSTPNRALSYRALIEYWVIKMQYYFVIDDREQVMNCTEKVFDIFENNPAFKKTLCAYYLGILSQLINLNYEAKDAGKMHKYLTELKSIKTYLDSDRINAFSIYIEKSIMYFELIRDDTSLHALLDEAYTGLKKWITRMRPETGMNLMATSLSVYTRLGQYDRILALVREFDEYIHGDYRLDIKVEILFYELIAQVETGNEVMVNNTLQNFNRFLLRHDFKSEFEQLMIRFLKIISSSSPETRDELAVLKERLLMIPEKSILNQHKILYPALVNLIDSKLSGVKYHHHMALQSDKN